jgi:hypothetical protein
VSLMRMCLRAEDVAVYVALRAADRLIGPWNRRRGLSPHVVLVAEASRAGADHTTALAVADRLLIGRTDGSTPSLRQLQRAARKGGA